MQILHVVQAARDRGGGAPPLPERPRIRVVHQAKYLEYERWKTDEVKDAEGEEVDMKLATRGSRLSIGRSRHLVADLVFRSPKWRSMLI